MMLSKMLVSICIWIMINSGTAYIHNISISNDGRKNIHLSSFGFFESGRLLVDITKFRFHLPRGLNFSSSNLKTNFGFTWQKTKSDGLSSYMEKKSTKCVLTDKKILDMKDLTMIGFHIDLSKPNINVQTYSQQDEDFKKIKISNDIQPNDNTTMELMKYLKMSAKLINLPFITHKCNVNKTENMVIGLNKDKDSFFTMFDAKINCPKQAGLYNLYFHNCMNYEIPEAIKIDLEVKIIEKNDGTFLSAGEIPLPTLYFFLSVTFFAAAIGWTVYLRKRKEWVYKIHWLMAVVVYLKALSLLTHGLNYHFTGKTGIHVGTWVILYYVIHLFKGALLFSTIVLIGTGYFFIKHVLSSKEKKIFLIVIPLQIILNVTQTIMDSTEEGSAMYNYYFKIVLAVDLLCCGAILLPVIWSIKHLSEAAKTDGKAAISLHKLKLFRQFYIMIVCYIYTTRIIVRLVKLTIPFHLVWVSELFTELATYVFFIWTGLKFRPVNDNPYLHLPQVEEEEEEEEDIELNPISTYSGYGERLTRVNRTDVNT